jgi:uncharacterized protein
VLALCDFFKAYNIRVGVSLDGPEHIHNARRVDRKGRGSFQRAMRGVRLLRDNGIDFGMIAVITKDSAQYPDELWRFFMELSPARLGFNPEEISGVNTQSSLQADEGIEQYRAFFKRILKLSAQANEAVIIREVEYLLSALISGSSLKRFVTNVPLKYLNFDYNGNISAFAPELLGTTHPNYGNFIFGNVLENTLEDVLNHPKFIEVSAQIEQGVEMCRETCDYFMFCGGGCPSNKLFENNTFCSTETRACVLHVKVPVDALVEYLEGGYLQPPSESPGI